MVLQDLRGRPSSLCGAKDTLEVRQSDVPDMMRAMRFALQKGGRERMNAMEQLRAI